MLYKKNENYLIFNKVFVAIIFLFSFFYFVTTVFGTYNNYSAVPFWDMWNGYLEFYFRAANEGWAPWWELHNEHRIVLAKAFFWLDLEYFKGSMVLLFTFNVIFSALTCVTFISVLSGLVKDYTDKLLYYAVSGILIVLCFSWLQSENYTWAFQSQFHMAYLLPLWAMLTLVKSKVENSLPVFLLACMLGMLSAVTMANGLLALPVMIALAVLVRMHWRYIATLALIMSVVYFFYFIDYTKPAGHPSLFSSFIDNPKETVRYFLLYLSGPFYGIFINYSRLAMAMGGVFLLGCLWALKYILFSRINDDEKYLKLSGLLAFLFFVGGTALLTSLGRAGYDPNIPSRYMTPAILNWCCLLVILTAMNYKRVKSNSFTYIALLFFPLALLPVQGRALTTPVHLHVHKVAAVAAALGVHDDKILDRVYFNIDRLFTIIKPAKDKSISIFNQKYIKDMYYFGDDFTLKPETKCDIYLDKVEQVVNSSEYSRVLGWAFDKTLHRIPDSIVFVDNSHQVVGFALTGSQRTDVAEAIDTLALNSGFIGYVLSNTKIDSSTHVYGVSDEFVCEY